VMSNAFVGYHSVVDSCIIDEGVTVGRLCYIGFGKSFLLGDKDITVVGKGVSVPSRTVIRRGSRVLPRASCLKNSPVPDLALSQASTVQGSVMDEEVQENERESVHAA
jgi:acetyltransferase-like isoleucine patch superfamily enzyme